VLDGVGELLPQAAGGNAFEAVDQFRDGDLGWVTGDRLLKIERTASRILIVVTALGITG
jgi:hypothetical protein